MTLPTFIGIGVPRGGTTWLHTFLSSHPDVYMPIRRKEIRFFERYYDRGLPWYETFFCPPEEAHRYKAIGEISTQYYDCEQCPRRIHTALPRSKLIVMLRHPVSRAYSHYGFVVQRRNYRGTFEEFLSSRENALEKGYYSKYLKNYLNYFDRSQLLALVHEEVFNDIEKTKQTIGNFLGIDADQFPDLLAKSKVNASSVPKYQSVYGAMVKTGRRLRKYNLEPVVDLLKRQGIDRFLSKGDALPPLDGNLKSQISRYFQEDIRELEETLQIDLSCWRDNSPSTIASAGAT